MRPDVRPGPLRYHLPVLVTAALVAVLLLVPGTGPKPGWLPPILADLGDKVVHGALFFLLAWLARRSARGLGLAWPGGVVWVLAVLYGALLEWLQSLGGWRSAELPDLAADAVGAALGVLAAAVRERLAG